MQIIHIICRHNKGAVTLTDLLIDNQCVIELTKIESMPSKLLSIDCAGSSQQYADALSLFCTQKTRLEHAQDSLWKNSLTLWLCLFSMLHSLRSLQCPGNNASAALLSPLLAMMSPPRSVLDHSTDHNQLLKGPTQFSQSVTRVWKLISVNTEPNCRWQSLFLDVIRCCLVTVPLSVQQKLRECTSFNDRLPFSAAFLNNGRCFSWLWAVIIRGGWGAV